MTYSKNNPYLATIKDNYLLNKEGSEKSTHHIVLNVKGSGINYKVGDSIGILPTNPSFIVEKTLKAMKISGKEIIQLPKTGEELSLVNFLTHRANIANLNKKLLKEIEQRLTKGEKKESLTQLLDSSNKEGLRHFLGERELWDFLEEFPEISLPYQTIAHSLRPLLPRLYSIASSKMSVGDEIHLTVDHLQYTTNDQTRHGVATHFLCHQAPKGKPIIPIYLYPSKDFTLPSNPTTPIIMVGPGTGIAPFRGFMQERLITKATNKNWLFCGDRKRATDFLYKDLWEELVKEGLLRIDPAFSRDQQEKVYVQHKLAENAAEIWDWIKGGAYFYVCGDAKRMAKDVDAILHKIVEEQGKLSHEDTKAYVKRLRSEKRYLRDIY